MLFGDLKEEKIVIFFLIFELFFLLKKNNIYVSVPESGLLLALIKSFRVLSRTNQSVVFVLWFEMCSNFNEVMGDSERAVCKLESSFRMRNVGFSVFLTCILPRFTRNAILLDR